MNLSPRLPSKKKKTAPSLKEKVICLRLAASQHRAQQKTGTLVALFFLTLPQLTIQDFDQGWEHTNFL
jgi:hypothetical protein